MFPPRKPRLCLQERCYCIASQLLTGSEGSVAVSKDQTPRGPALSTVRSADLLCCGRNFYFAMTEFTLQPISFLQFIARKGQNNTLISCKNICICDGIIWWMLELEIFSCFFVKISDRSLISSCAKCKLTKLEIDGEIEKRHNSAIRTLRKCEMYFEPQ